MLAFPLILVRPYSMAIGTVILGVHIQHCLHIIISRGQVTQVGDGIAKYVSIDNNLLSGCHLVNIFGPKRYAFKIRTCFVSWLRLRLPADSDEHTPGNGRMAGSFDEGN